MKYPTVVFIDRDGTLGPDVGYCARAEDFSLYPEASEAIKLLNEKDIPVVLVTNQSGVGRGYFSVEDLAGIHDKIVATLAAGGAKIDGIEYCPHRPEDDCMCRKPKLGMFISAMQKLHLPVLNAYMIGDSESDMLAAQRLGAGAVHVSRDGDEPAWDTGVVDYHATNVLDAARWVLRDSQDARHVVDVKTVTDRWKTD